MPKGFLEAAYGVCRNNAQRDSREGPRRREHRDRMKKEYETTDDQLGWMFSTCGGVCEPVAICATHNQSPFVFQGAAKHPWPSNDGLAEFANGCCITIKASELGLKDVMNYGVTSSDQRAVGSLTCSLRGVRDVSWDQG